MLDWAKEFHSLFEGSDLARGTFNLDATQTKVKKKGTASVVRIPATIEHWQNHLDGKTGVGIIPINSFNKCKWGAIDIDSYDVNHKELATKLKENKIPAVVGRSKSGGAHVWVFIKSYIEAEDMQERLMELASALGYAGSEVFPKQKTILAERGDTGNFLNMPYHGGDKTMRYAFDSKGEGLSVNEFLGIAKGSMITPSKFKGLDLTLGSSKEALKSGPPCLNRLCGQGFPSGTRNNGLFNLGIYAKMFDGDNYESLIHKYNMDYLDPPLNSNEVSIIIKQLQKKDYFYKCDDQPLQSFCNKEVCKTQKYGVGPAGVTNSLSSLTKIDGDPPIWLMNVDSERLELSTTALTTQAQFARECVAQINKFPVQVSQRAWQTRIQILLDNVTIIEVPPDATLKGQFEELLYVFGADRAKGDDKQDILSGNCVWIEGRVYFQVKDIKRHLQANDFPHFDSNKIVLTLQELEAEKKFWKVKGRGVHVWSLPEDFFTDEEDEQLDLPELPDDEAVL
tara:strand:- start:361 stop:1887 length:1527 start_codon:yes stop_codon:yes gene_type:complete